MVDDARAQGPVRFVNYDRDFALLYVSPFFGDGYENIFTVARVDLRGVHRITCREDNVARW